jgi:hypothetical protein
MGIIKVSNKPNIPDFAVDFDLSKFNINSNYNIIMHHVYDPFNKFDTEYAFLDDPTLDENTLIVLWHPVEMGAWNQKWVDRFNKYAVSKPYKLLYITGCTNKLDLDKFFDIKFDYTFMPVFDYKAAKQWKFEPAEITTTKSNKFVCLNAKDTCHRRYILNELYTHNLIKEGIVSYTCINGIQPTHSDFPSFHTGRWFTESQMQKVYASKENTVPILPIVLDTLNRVEALPRTHFTDSYINIVNETDFAVSPHSNRCSFLTEKTFNALANNQMFIVVGHAYSLELLRDLGYKTFDGIIDESYDQILHNGDRLEAVSAEIVRFLSRSIEEIQADYLRALPIIEHNRNLIYSQNIDQRLQEVLDRYAR